MRTQAPNMARGNGKTKPIAGLGKVLLVGRKEMLSGRASRHFFFGGHRARISARAATPQDALPHLNSGAIDVVWLSREFHPEELLDFAVEAKRRGYNGMILQAETAPSGSPINDVSNKRKPIRAGDFVVDVDNHRVWARGEETQLTPQEFALLAHFIKHPRELLTHEHLLQTLWGDIAAPIAPLRVLIQTLRAKVETSAIPRYIVTQHRLGYRFNPSSYPIA